MTTDSQVKEALSRVSKDERIVLLSIKEKMDAALKGYSEAFATERAQLQAELDRLSKQNGELKEKIEGWEKYVSIIHEKGELLNVVDLQEWGDKSVENIAQSMLKFILEEHFQPLEKQHVQLLRDFARLNESKFNNWKTLLMVLEEVFQTKPGFSFTHRKFTLPNFAQLGKEAGWLPFTFYKQSALAIRITNDKLGQANNETYDQIMSQIKEETEYRHALQIINKTSEEKS